jgi:hypothetical protein
MLLSRRVRRIEACYCGPLQTKVDVTQNEKQEWQLIRTRGRGQFILRYGLLRAGVVFWVVTALIWIMRLLWDASRPEDPIKEIIVAAFTGLVTAWVSAHTHWQKMEEDFQKPTEAEAVE